MQSRVGLDRLMKSLEHASQCRDGNCRVSSCLKMRRVIEHTRVCSRRQKNECNQCKQLIALCACHARTCNNSSCYVTYCDNIRQRLKQRRLQQQSENLRVAQRRFQTTRQNHKNGTTEVAGGTNGSSAPATNFAAIVRGHHQHNLSASVSGNPSQITGLNLLYYFNSVIYLKAT